MFSAFLSAAAQKMVEPSQNEFDWITLFTSVFAAALISALVSFVGQWITRQNAKLAAQIAQENARLSANLEVAKTLAQSRQDWINVLRDDIAQFVGLSAKRSRLLVADENLSNEEFAELVSVGARIRMRMNPADEDFDALLGLMARCANEKKVSLLGKANSDLVKTSQKILKREWEVLKADFQSLNIGKDSAG